LRSAFNGFDLPPYNNAGLALCLLLVVIYQAFEIRSADLIIDQLVVGFQVQRVERETEFV
jgi:hypothetical protein